MVNYQKLYGMIGLATKAGKVVSGTDACMEAIEGKKVKLVILAKDAADRTKNQFKDICQQFNVPIYEICNIEDLSKSIGKANKAVVGIKEKGFIQAIKKIIDGGEVSEQD